MIYNTDSEANDPPRHSCSPSHKMSWRSCGQATRLMSSLWTSRRRWQSIPLAFGYQAAKLWHIWAPEFMDQQFPPRAIPRVVCNGEHSEQAPLLSGVRQGSVIGPILFLIYINDLPENVNSTVRLFADDTIMYMTIASDSDATSLQRDLDSLVAGEEKWQMKFHPKKCSVLRITRRQKSIIHQYQLHGHILDTETNSKYLGVTINNKLCWNNHINNICKKANSSLAFLRRNLQIFQTHIKANAYTTLVRPQLEYVAAVWDPYTKGKRNQIEMVQRRAARFAFRDYQMKSSVTALLEKLNWRSLEQRRAGIRLSLFHKCLHGLVAVDLWPDLVPSNSSLPSQSPNVLHYSIWDQALYIAKLSPKNNSPVELLTGRYCPITKPWRL